MNVQINLFLLFFEPGNYVEAGLNVTDYNISAKTTSDVVGALSGNTTKNFNLGEIGSTDALPNFALKTEINDKFSVGLIYDQPFGADIHYKDAIRYMGTNSQRSKIDIDTQNFSLLLGYKPNNNIQLYAAPVYQQLKSSLHLYGPHTRHSALFTTNNYLADFKKDDAYGWLAGIAFHKEDLTAAITYRSSINHKFQADEGIKESATTVVPAGVYESAIQQQSNFKTPQSVNIDISKKLTNSTTTLLNVRWIDWSNFEFHLPYYQAKTSFDESRPGGSIGKAGGYNPIAYNKDQWSIDLGLVQKLSDKWQVNGSLGWDSGVGDYISHYTPINGSWNAGVGVQFNPAQNYFIQTGIKYIWLDDVKGQHAKQIAQNSSLYDTEFNDSYALNYNLKIGYRF